MNNTNLIKLLRSLDRDEFRRFKKFLQSPYYNSNPLVLKLYEVLKPFYPDFDSLKMTKERIFRRLFAGKKYHDGRMRNLISDLKILTEEYLTDLELKKNKFEKKKVLNQAYAHRNLFSFFEKTTKHLIDELEALPYKDIHVYNNEMWLKYEYFFHPQTDKYKKPIFTIEDVMEDMDRFFVLGKWQFGSEIKNRERIFANNVKPQFLDISMSATDAFKKENPIFNLYENIFLLHDAEKNEQTYEIGKRQLEKFNDKISRDDGMNVLLNLRNYAIGKINKGLTAFHRELLALYKLGLELDLILDNNKIKEADFTNIVSMGSLEHEFAWTKNFIEEYEKYLDDNVREDAKILGLAILYFHSKNYEAAMDQVGQHQFSNPVYQISTKTLLVRVWFEQFFEDNDQYDFLLSQLEAFEKLIRRNNYLATEKKEVYINFILAIKKLADLVYRKETREEIDKKMYRYLENSKRMISKKWFEEKIDQIKNHHTSK